MANPSTLFDRLFTLINSHARIHKRFSHADSSVALTCCIAQNVLMLSHPPRLLHHKVARVGQLKLFNLLPVLCIGLKELVPL
jgi:hypothetical protein